MKNEMAANLFDLLIGRATCCNRVDASTAMRGEGLTTNTKQANQSWFSSMGCCGSIEGDFGCLRGRNVHHWPTIEVKNPGTVVGLYRSLREHQENMLGFPKRKNRLVMCIFKETRACRTLSVEG